MEVVNTLDIDGTQWEIRDEEARKKIADLEYQLSTQELQDITIKMNENYNSSYAVMYNHYKVGKIHFMNVVLSNISGENIGTTSAAIIGLINIKPKKVTGFLLHDYVNNVTFYCYLDENGFVVIADSMGLAQGNNACLGQLIFAEA